MPRDFAVAAALAGLLRLAVRIESQVNLNQDLAFDSILIACIFSSDPFSRWLREYARKAGIDIQGLLARYKADPATLEKWAASNREEAKQGAAWRCTISALSLMDAAQESARTTTRKQRPDVRHLIGALLLVRVGHEGALSSMGLWSLPCSQAFLHRIALFHPEELDAWKTIQMQAFPEASAEAAKGPSPHISSDIWTANDTLGYKAYALAIAAFMTHPLTRPPLTIGIQAPWGGGKTSLMRMIRSLLDPKAGEPKDKPAARRLTVREALEEITLWVSGGTSDDLMLPQLDNVGQRLTIWFNAWKYESANQVWAGMADAIMRQVTDRMTLRDRELFWLRLNLGRLDALAIRRRVHEGILDSFWRRARAWIIGCGVAAIGSLVAALAGSAAVQDGGLIGLAASVFTGAASAVVKFLREKGTAEKAAASVSLADCMSVPDYRGELGFVHHVEADVRKALECIPKKHKPIAIFIDDLDRCTPTKVAQVVEAVNLFLAGDFPDCIFVLGMDSEMVAAALKAAHREMIENLPTDAGIPIGWRFMDKFVQLPFIVPPAEESEVARYTRSLFASGSARKLDEAQEKSLQSVAETLSSPLQAGEVAKEVQDQIGLPDELLSQAQDAMEDRVIRRRLDEGIATFTDDNPEIQRVVSTAVSCFAGNPRELKRFLNSFRFHYFIWRARKAPEKGGLTLDQILRWTILSLRWPEVARWVRRSSGTDWRIVAPIDGKGSPVPTITRRLKLLERISGEATSLATWQAKAMETLYLTPAEAPWLCDDDLLEFFYNESTKVPAGERLSDGEGKGLW